MRAVPAFSLAYLGDTAFGKVAAPAVIGMEADEVGGTGLRGLGADEVEGTAATSDVPPSPHWALRKSFHFNPPSVPAVCASLYFALHSRAVRAWAGAPAATSAPAAPAAARLAQHTRALLLAGAAPGAGARAPAPLGVARRSRGASPLLVAALRGTAIGEQGRSCALRGQQ